MQILQQQRSDMQEFIQSTIGATLEMVATQQPKEMQVVVQQAAAAPAPQYAPQQYAPQYMQETGRAQP